LKSAFIYASLRTDIKENMNQLQQDAVDILIFYQSYQIL